MKKPSHLWKVLLAIVLGAIAGSITKQDMGFFGLPYFKLYELFSQLFLNSLTLLAIPMVASAIISGLGQMKEEKSFSHLGKKTFSLYLFFIASAVIVGIIAFNLIHPGRLFVLDSKPQLENFSAFSSPLKCLFSTFYKLIPSNIIEAAASGNMMGVIFFSLLFGFALIKLQPSLHLPMVNFWKGLFQVLMNITQLLMRFLPFGVFCLMAKTTALQGLNSFSGLLWFFLAVVIGFLVFCFVVIPVVLKITGINPIAYLKSISPALITAFSTSSSAATLPVTMECLEKRVGVSSRVAGFVVPLGLSMNMAGSALYECSAILFIAEVYGVPLSFGHQFLIAIFSLVTSMGISGVPSGSLVGVMMILNALGLPPEGIALVLPLDRILDMCRTATNVYSDASCAALIAKSEGELLFPKEKLEEQISSI